MGAIGAHEGGGDVWGDAVATHSGFLLAGEARTVWAGVDFVAVWKALRPELFSRGQHSHADISDGVGGAVDVDCYHAHAVIGGQRMCRLGQISSGALTVEFSHEGRDKGGMAAAGRNCAQGFINWQAA